MPVHTPELINRAALAIETCSKALATMVRCESLALAQLAASLALIADHACVEPAPASAPCNARPELSKRTAARPPHRRCRFLDRLRAQPLSSATASLQAADNKKKRFQFLDMASEQGKNDAEFEKMVRPAGAGAPSRAVARPAGPAPPRAAPPRCARATSQPRPELHTSLPPGTAFPPFGMQVQDVQDQANTGVRGWMVARGAFDRGDLLFMRQEEEKRRQVEQDQEDQERHAVRAGEGTRLFCPAEGAPLRVPLALRPRRAACCGAARLLPRT